MTVEVKSSETPATSTLPKKVPIDYSTYKTIVNIPIERAPKDPSWLLKYNSRTIKLDPVEAEESLKYAFEEEYQKHLVEACPVNPNQKMARTKLEK